MKRFISILLALLMCASALGGAVIAGAEEAKSVGVEHLMLSVLREECVAIRLLRECAIDTDELQTVTFEDGNGDIVGLRRLAVGGGNIEFAILFEPVSEVELQIIHVGGGEIDPEVLTLVDSGHIIAPVGFIDEPVSGDQSELRGGLVTVDEDGTGLFGTDGHIFHLFGDQDRLVISSGHDGQGIPVFQGVDARCNGGVLLTGTHHKFSTVQDAE